MTKYAIQQVKFESDGSNFYAFGPKFYRIMKVEE